MKFGMGCIRKAGLGLAALLLCAVLSSCSSLAWKKPRVELVKVELAGGNLFEQKLQLKLRVHNQNPYAIGLEGLVFSVFVGEEKVAGGTLPAPVEIAANAQQELDLSGRANLLALLRRLPDGAISNGELHYRILGEAQVRNYGMAPFEHEGRLNLSRLLAPARAE